MHSSSRKKHDKSTSQSSRDSGESARKPDPIVDELKNKSDRRRQKELVKALETPEEKRMRRLLKKEAKERKRKERMGWDKDYMAS